MVGPPLTAVLPKTQGLSIHFCFPDFSVVAMLDLVALICLENHKTDLQIVIPLSVFRLSHGRGANSDNLGMSWLEGYWR